MSYGFFAGSQSVRCILSTCRPGGYTDDPGHVSQLRLYYFHLVDWHDAHTLAHGAPNWLQEELTGLCYTTRDYDAARPN